MHYTAVGFFLCVTESFTQPICSKKLINLETLLSLLCVTLRHVMILILLGFVHSKLCLSVEQKY